MPPARAPPPSSPDRAACSSASASLPSSACWRRAQWPTGALSTCATRSRRPRRSRRQASPRSRSPWPRAASAATAGSACSDPAGCSAHRGRWPPAGSAARSWWARRRRRRRVRARRPRHLERHPRALQRGGTRTRDPGRHRACRGRDHRLPRAPRRSAVDRAHRTRHESPGGARPRQRLLGGDRRRRPRARPCRDSREERALVTEPARALFVPVLLGTVRQGRMSLPVARLVVSELSRRPGIETELIDIARLPLPIDDAGQAIKDPTFSAQMSRADALVVVSPEYNHGYSGLLKHALDSCLEEYIHKAVGVVGVSAGPYGGTRGIQDLLPVLRELGLVAIFWDVNFSAVQSAFDETGALRDQTYLRRIDKFLKELVWMAWTLRHGREHIALE